VDQLAYTTKTAIYERHRADSEVLTGLCSAGGWLAGSMGGAEQTAQLCYVYH